MGHVVRDTKWGLIDINTDTGQIIFQQRWKYFWLSTDAFYEWTLKDKKKFHRQADLAIWNAWSNKVKLQVNGSAPFAKKFAGRRIPLNFDIRWVTAKAHWVVSVTHIGPDDFQRSYVSWDRRQIYLDTGDIVPYTYTNKTKPYKTAQVVVAHEFGHSIGDYPEINGSTGDDEYPKKSPYYSDNASIMHSGMQLRARHFRGVLDEINDMIPGCNFSLLAW